MKAVSLLGALVLTACTMITVPESPPVTADVPPEVQAALAPPPRPVVPAPPVQPAPIVTTVSVAEGSPQTAAAAWAAAGPRGVPGPPLPAAQTAPARQEPVAQPTAIIRAAQQASQVLPTRRGYHGNSNTMRWNWEPGKLYIIRVNSAQMTKITLPPGERLVSKIFLDPEAWDVQSYRVGSETLTQDVVFVRPQAERGAKDVNVALLTEQGHSFDVRLEVREKEEAMFAVTWNAPELPVIVQDETPLRSAP